MAKNLYKWPRTYHLHSSPGLQNDDRKIPSEDVFKQSGKNLHIGMKMDGEGATMTREKTYPRSPDARPHPSRDWMKAYHAQKAHHIPEGWRISGEYMYALHSIPYTRENGNALTSYFQGFGVWNENNVLLSWDETLEIFELLEIQPAPTLYRGPYKPGLFEDIASSLDTNKNEGFVVRVDEQIAYPTGPGNEGRFFSKIAKYVRAKHVATDEHWMTSWRNQPGYINELIEGVPLYK